MHKSIQTISKVTFFGIMLAAAYTIGTTRAETVIETQKVIKTVEVIPNDYIALNDCIPLEDVGCYFINSYDYPSFELKDVATQYNADNTRSYADIMAQLPDETSDFQENFVDMRNVVDFSVTESGLQLYFKDGTGYYLEMNQNDK